MASSVHPTPSGEATDPPGLESDLTELRHVPDLPKRSIPADVLRVFPAEFAQQHRVVPLSIQNGLLAIATATPGNHQTLDDIRLLSGLEVEEYLSPSDHIVQKIAECYQVTVEKMIENLDSAQNGGGESKNLHDIEVMANEPTVVNLVNLIISTALRERASDIHLLPFENSLQLRYRIDGLLQETAPPPKPLHAALVSRIKIMADMNIAERFMPQDGHIQINHRGARVDIRVGTMPNIHGESLVMRLLVKDEKLKHPRELGLGESRAALLDHLVRKPHGLFLTTGPTGSGKTTTLYSILQGLNAPEKKVVTIEDPVEYELAGVSQIPVRPSRGFTFAHGLRAILRQDPDIVMVGEIRDAETAEIAIRAALTGHQVFSTLHTNDAPSAVTRLIDMGVEPFLISSSLEGVLGQRLVRRICPVCRRPSPILPAIRSKLEAMGGHSLTGEFYEGAGCDQCRSGYLGRVGIFELLAITSPLREMILQKRSATELRGHATRQMITMQQDAMQKAVEGLTTLEEIVRVCASEAQE